MYILLVSQAAIGWILDVKKDYDNNNITILIKLIDGKVISFQQKLNEHTFYILPKSSSVGEDLLQQLSRQDQIIKRIFWNEKYIDLHDKNKTQLIGISLTNSQEAGREGFRMLIQKLNHDSRVKALYNIDLSDVMGFIYTKLKIAPTSKVKVEYDDRQLLFIERIDGDEEIIPPPFSMMFIQTLSGDAKKEQPKLIIRTDARSNATALEITSLSDPNFISYLTKINPDIIIFCGDNQPLYSQNDAIFKGWFKYKVIIHSRNPMEDIELLELVEKARFGYLPIREASKYGMMRLIDSRITFEMLQRDFVIPLRRQTISKYHEQIRTLENIVENDKAGMIISPEIGLHENVTVLDFNDEYANLIMNHDITYENLSTDNTGQAAILPSIVSEIVARRVHLKRLLKANLDSETQLYCQLRLDALKQILVCLYGHQARSGTDLVTYVFLKR